jgi:hypothetical protein
MEILLAPVAMLIGHLGLSESFPPYLLPHPMAALILVPVELLLASTVMFACDAMAERLDITERRRFGLCIAVGIVAWPVAAAWGHAEDILALTFTIYALRAMLDGRWKTAGWLLGFGVAVQPLVALALPLLIASTPRGQRMFLAVRSAALSILLVGVAFAGDPSDAYRQLIQQPTPPSINHATPWVWLAPNVATSPTPHAHSTTFVPGIGHPVLSTIAGQASQIVEVSGGAGRIIDVVLAFLLGLYVWRRPQPATKVLWLVALVLASRCFFEPVMTPYYLGPPLIMCLVLAARRPGKRFWTAVILTVEVTVFAYHHLNPWVWWVPIVAGLATILALGYPSDLATRRREPVESDAGGADQEGCDHLTEPDTFDAAYRSRQPALR